MGAGASSSAVPPGGVPRWATTFCPFVVAFVAYTMLDLGKVFQKIGLAVMSSRRLRGMAIWLAASTATSASTLLTLYAVSLGSALIVASMAGTGVLLL